jgi:hypothetical protein
VAEVIRLLRDDGCASAIAATAILSGLVAKTGDVATAAGRYFHPDDRRNAAYADGVRQSAMKPWVRPLAPTDDGAVRKSPPAVQR